MCWERREARPSRDSAGGLLSAPLEAWFWQMTTAGSASFLTRGPLFFSLNPVSALGNTQHCILHCQTPPGFHVFTAYGFLSFGSLTSESEARALEIADVMEMDGFEGATVTASQDEARLVTIEAEREEAWCLPIICLLVNSQCHFAPVSNSTLYHMHFNPFTPLVCSPTCDALTRLITSHLDTLAINRRLSLGEVDAIIAASTATFT